MKKILLLVLMIAMAVSISAQTATEPSGEGSEEQPYQIATLENLYWLQTQGFTNFAVQTADINAAETANWFTDGEGGYYGWPVGTCDGNYDGQGYTIDSLYINRSSTNYASLFGYASGPVSGLYEIKNLKLTNVDITGNEQVGALVGLSTKFNISNCSSSGTVEGVSGVGGLIGSFRAAFTIPDTLQNCYSTASVTATSTGGGLAGTTIGATNGAATVYNCYAKGSVNSGGGLIGSVTKSSLMLSYATGAVTSGGGLVGGSDSGGEGGSTDFSCYWDYQTVGQISSPHGTPKSTVQMQTQSTFSGWDFTSTWSINGSLNDGYPYLQTNLPEGATPIELAEFDAMFDKGMIRLEWKTASETNNAYFLIYRNDEVIGSLEGAGTTSETHYYSYCDPNVVPGGSYVYKLADVSYSNDIVIYEDFAVTVTVGENIADMTYALDANYPNPFNPNTSIPYSISEEQEVTLSIYDISGKMVRSLVSEIKSAGYHTALWNGKNDMGLDVESGMYISRITAGDYSASKKMLLVK